jgi:hypothetical protein
MSGFEIVGVVLAAIAAVKTIPEIPGAWRRLFGTEKKKPKVQQDFLSSKICPSD